MDSMAERMQDIIGELQYGGALEDEEPEVEDNPDLDPEDEAEPPQDNPDEDPEPEGDESDPEDEEPDEAEEAEEEAHDEGDEEEAEEVEEEEEVEAEPESGEELEEEEPEPEEEGDDGEFIEIDGHKVPKELEGYLLRQQDYSRKTQELAQQRQLIEQQQQAQQEILTDIQRDDGMKEFLAEHPEAISYLLRAPEATKKLIGNREALNEFWADYETLSENPRLAERFAAGERKEFETQRQQQNLKQTVEYVSTTIQDAVNQVAEHYGVEPEQVPELEKYVLSLGGVTEESPPEDAVRGIGRLYNIFFTQQNGQLVVDTQLIQEKAKALASTDETSGERKKRKREEHNRKVKGQIKKSKNAQKPPPAGGEVPGVADEPEPEHENLSGLLEDLRYGDSYVKG